MKKALVLVALLFLAFNAFPQKSFEFCALDGRDWQNMNEVQKNFCVAWILVGFNAIGSMTLSMEGVSNEIRRALWFTFVFDVNIQDAVKRVSSMYALEKDKLELPIWMAILYVYNRIGFKKGEEI